MPTMKELIELRNKLSHDAREVMNSIKPGVDAGDQTEKRAKVDALLAEKNRLNEDINRLASLAEEPETRGAQPRDGFESADNRSQEERNRASNIALRSYLRGEKFETRDLTVAADGGVMIPVAAVPPVVAQRSAGSIYDIVGKMRTSTGEDVRVPLWDDTTDHLVDDGTSVGGGTDPSITGVTVKTGGLRTGDPLLIDNKLIQDVSYDLLSYVNQSLTERYQRGLAQLINTNSGSLSYFTPLKGNVPVSVTTTSTTGFDGYDNFPKMVGTLDPAYWSNAVWTFNATTYSAVLDIKDSYGRPIFLPLNDGANSGFVGTILGFPVKVNQYQDSLAAGNVPLYFGDFQKGFMLREVLPGIVIKQSNQRWIELNRLGVIGFARAGGSVTLANSTTYSPIQALAIHA